MANERRVRSQAVFGTLSASIVAGDTTINGAGLANLAAIGATEHAAIVLDPKRTAGAPEIVYVTAHTAAATSATVTRGQEGTTARSHASATEWGHVPTPADYVGGSRLIVRRAASQAIPSATLTAISWDTEDIDTDAFIAVTSSTITIPTLLGGVYAISAVSAINGGAPTGRHLLEIAAGGSTWRSTIEAGEDVGSVSVVVRLNAADTIVTNIFQTGAATGNLTARLELYRLSA